MDRAFQYAISPRRHYCLGLRLAELTLGHWFLLAKYCAPLVDSESDAEFSLPLAVLICSQDKPITPDRWWVRLFCILWGRKCRKLDMAVEVQKFKEYIKDSLSHPEISVKESQSIRETSTPTGFWILSFLMSSFHMSREQAMRLRISEAMCLRTAQSEDSGHINLRTSRSRQLAAYAKRIKLNGADVSYS